MPYLTGHLGRIVFLRRSQTANNRGSVRYYIGRLPKFNPSRNHNIPTFRNVTWTGWVCVVTHTYREQVLRASRSVKLRYAGWNPQWSAEPDPSYRYQHRWYFRTNLPQTRHPTRLYRLKSKSKPYQLLAQQNFRPKLGPRHWQCFETAT